MDEGGFRREEVVDSFCEGWVIEEALGVSLEIFLSDGLKAVDAFRGAGLVALVVTWWEGERCCCFLSGA